MFWFVSAHIAHPLGGEWCAEGERLPRALTPGDDQRLISQRRNALIRKGLIYAPEHGLLDYTVPQFADYLRRQHPD